MVQIALCQYLAQVSGELLCRGCPVAHACSSGVAESTEARHRIVLVHSKERQLFDHVSALLGKCHPLAQALNCRTNVDTLS